MEKAAERKLRASRIRCAVPCSSFSSLTRKLAGAAPAGFTNWRSLLLSLAISFPSLAVKGFPSRVTWKRMEQ